MNVGEYGVRFVYSTGFDMSAFTTISITFTKPSGATLTVANPDVTVPNTEIETTEGLFNANEYAQYIFENGDVDEEGSWSARVTYTDAGQHLISDAADFAVGA